MTVYNLNLGIGWASSGVEYAQMYRSIILNRLGVDTRFVFTDMILYENIEHLTFNIGLRDDQVIWLYQYFSDIPIAPTTYTLQDLLASLGKKPYRSEREGKVARYLFSDAQTYLTCYLKEESSDFVERVEYVANGNLIRKDYFSNCRYMTEYYTPRENRAYLYIRRILNQDGSVALEIIEDGEDRIYRVKNQIFYCFEELMAYFIQSLSLTDQDIVLMDRSTRLGEAVLENRGAAKVGTIVHADHFSEPSAEDRHILWNNYYEYEFHYAKNIDFFVCSTAAQSELMSKQFQEYCGFVPKIYTIPVGNLTSLSKPKKTRIPHSILTASRLASEKHIDWLIGAVAKAHESVPDLIFDIYGTGGEEQKIRDRIREMEAESYITLKGHQHLQEIYPCYDLYLSASTSEGFGLSLMEAVGAGLPIIGFDVRYGNPTFIDDGENGFLIAKDPNWTQSEMEEVIADRIVRFMEGDVAAMQAHSYEVAKGYLQKNVAKQWKALIEEVLGA